MWLDNIDAHGWQEVENLGSLPFVFRHIALMPDAHGGKGMPIGTVLATRDVVIPNAVGVDIGCGMCAMRTSIRLEELTDEILRKRILRGIRKRIPIGTGKHHERQDERYMPSDLSPEGLEIVSRQYLTALRQIGTLGGGNHFIELQRSSDGYLWVMIHSGSRNLGKQVADYYDTKARRLNDLWHSRVSSEMQLAFLPRETKEFHDYWAEMRYCVAFAKANRELMMNRIAEVIAEVLPHATFDPIINIAHNYADWEHHFDTNVIVHRKGATSARAGQIGIIPGSQGTRSYIVEGLGNAESYTSCSHGAGRLLSRTAARNELSVEIEVAQLDARGIIHSIRSVKDLDEAPGAYKDIDEVMRMQSDLVRPLVELSPIAVIKG